MEVTSALQGSRISPNAQLQHIPGLPDSVVLRILKFLSLGDLANFCRVSKGCNEIASSDLLWHSLAEEYSPGAIPLGYSQKESEKLLEDCMLQRFDKIPQLLSEGANPNVAGPPTRYTPLHLAAGYGHVNAINTLLKAGAALEAQTAFGRTPLHYAAEKDHPNAINALLQAGATLEAQDGQRKTPLHVAAGLGRVNAIDALLKAGATPKARDAQGRTPLHDAAVLGNPNGINALLKAGATLKARDAQGRTPLHDAAVLGNPNGINALLQGGTTPGRDNAPDTACSIL